MAISGACVGVYGPAAAAMFVAYTRRWYFGVSNYCRVYTVRVLKRLTLYRTPHCVMILIESDGSLIKLNNFIVTK